ncbi:MAG: hypothetical protein QE487_04255 [Fluviicola sp.]|nr:hypothetical protein [Fluviicola sp.]
MGEEKKKTEWTRKRLEGFKKGKLTTQKEKVIKKVEEKLKPPPRKN